jgi:Flp pilus assembly protein TadG
MRIISFAPGRSTNSTPSGSSGIKPAALARVRRGSVRRCLELLQREDGGPLIELAMFVLPLTMMCLTAMFTFGIAIYNALLLTQATGAGAEYLQQIRTTTADPCADTLSAIESAAPTLKGASITLTLTINGGTPVTSTSCPSQTSNLLIQKPVTVATSYPCALVIYGLNLGGCQLAAKVTEYEY